MTPGAGPLLMYGLVLVATILIFAGVGLVALGVGWWARRKAQREGRVCPHCGLWDEPVEILIHHIQEHEHER